jgi:hypothetical protein
MLDDNDHGMFADPDPLGPAVHVERLLDEDGHGRVAMLRHPDAPFVRVLPDATDIALEELHAALRGIANEYVAHMQPAAGLPPELLQTLQNNPGDGFGWHDITWGHASIATDPRLSFWVAPDGDSRAGLTVVLLAGNRRGQDHSLRSEGGSVGLRVVMHVRVPEEDGRCTVRVTSMSLSGLKYARAGGRASVSSQEIAAAIPSMAKTLGLDVARTKVVGVVVDQDGAAQLLGTGVRGSDDAERVFSWATDLAPAASTDAHTWTCNRGAPQSSCLDGPEGGPGFRPRGADADATADAAALAAVQHWLLGQHREPAPSNNRRVGSGRAGRAARSAPSAPLRALKLSWPDKHPQFEVVRSPLRQQPRLPAKAVQSRTRSSTPRKSEPQSQPQAQASHEPDRVQEIPATPTAAPALGIRPSLQACLRAIELIDRLTACGVAPAHYFKFARLPLRVRPSASFRFRPDGLTVNAMVQPDGVGLGIDEAFEASKLPRLEVLFGVASTSRRMLLVNEAGRPRSEYPSLAHDVRWAWHEFGHVLLFASTGEIEFRFAHSAGDALAAILADDLTGPVDAPGRFSTFPVQRLPRRHDRPAHLGWCWCGRRNGLRGTATAGPPRLFGGYFEEQLLSSSLFRLYRAIGGDSAYEFTRKRAAEYVAYLILRAIALLGPAATVPARSVDHFVSALIDADIGTIRWRFSPFVGGDGTAARTFERIGSTVHKVIRWAFEQQGLYATDDPNRSVEGAGQPPAVDIYIRGQGARALGGYHPVSADDSAVGGGTPDWHASSEGLWKSSNGQRLCVRIDNRGRHSAMDVEVRAWLCVDDGAGPGRWEPLAPDAAITAPIGPDGGTTTFCFACRPQASAHHVLVAVTCPGDRDNLDLRSGLPCAKVPPPLPGPSLTDLVLCDNNLALGRFDADTP